MAKRRLSDQQRRRIERIQAIKARRAANKQQVNSQQVTANDTNLGEEQAGRILTHFGQTLAVLDSSGNTIRCIARQNLGPLVCGDQVIWQAERDSGSKTKSGVIVARQDRDNLLKRKDGFGNLKPVAANISSLCIVNAPLPRFSTGLIDRYIVAAESLGIKPILLLNKSDTLDEESSSDIHKTFDRYKNLGYSYHFVSARQAETLQPLFKELKDQTSILVGQSGVGKSSLANTLIPDLNLRTKSISELSGLGTHTTTATTLYDLPNGGQLIDSPGVRSFGLLPMSRDAIASGFVEFHPYLGHCRFHNCSHLHEPGCAIRDALAEDKIDTKRYDSFLAIAEESEE